MKTKLFLVAAPALVALLSQPAAGAGLTTAAQSFSAAHPGAAYVSDESGASRYYVVRGFRSTPLAGDRAEAARLFALENGALIGLGTAEAGLDLVNVAAHRDQRFYQFEQTLYDLPVFNARVIVSVDGQGRVFKISSKAVTEVPSAQQADLDSLDAEIAAAAAVQGMGPAYDIQLGWFASEDTARLVWRVIAPAPGVHVIATFVDAHTGAVAFMADLVRDVQANVYPENPVVDGETSIVDLPNVNGDAVVDAGADAGVVTGLVPEGAYARAATCTSMDAYGMCQAWETQSLSNENGFLDIVPNLEDPTASTDPFAEISAYFYIDQQNTWFRSRFGYAGQYADMENTGDDADWLWAMVNLDYNNAAYVGGYGSSGDSIIVGQGSNGVDTIDYSYDGDVLYHEFTHSVSSKQFNVGYGTLDSYGVDSTAGGVEEGNADYFAVSHHGNSQLGEYSLGTVSGRDADNDDSCPASLVGESHYDSGMISGAMWEVRTAIGADKTDHLDYEAMSSNDVENFADFAAAMISTAQDMAAASEFGFTTADADTVAGVMESRGLVACERVVDMWVDGATVTKLHYADYDITQGQGGTPSAMQYRITTGPNTRSIKLLIEPTALKTYGALMRVGAPIEFTWTGSGYQYTWTALYDQEWTGDDTTPLTEITIDNTTDIQVQPNTEYYFSLLCISSSYSGNGCVSYVTSDVTDGEGEVDAGADSGASDADADADTDTDTNADAGTGGSSDDGCGCAAAGSAAPATSLLGLLF